MVSVERNIITFSAAISVFPDKMLGGDWRLERIHIVVAHLHRNLRNDFWLKGNLRKDRGGQRKSFGLWERFESKNVHFHHKVAKCRKVN